jgi:hypothetical protein
VGGARSLPPTQGATERSGTTAGRNTAAPTAPVMPICARSSGSRSVVRARRSVLRRAGAGPEVDVGVGGVPVDLCQLVGSEVEAIERGDVVLELGNAARANHQRGHPRVAQGPDEGQLGEALAASRRDLVEGADPCQTVFGQHVAAHSAAGRNPRSSGHAVQVAIREQALCQRREGDTACAATLGIALVDTSVPLGHVALRSTAPFGEGVRLLWRRFTRGRRHARAATRRRPWAGAPTATFAMVPRRATAREPMVGGEIASTVCLVPG